VDPGLDYDCFEPVLFLCRLAGLDTGDLLFTVPFPPLDDGPLVGPFCGDLGIFSRGLEVDPLSDWTFLLKSVFSLEFALLFHKEKSVNGFHR
jgi:hypothetical protein